jgi:hypothetical protein
VGTTDAHRLVGSSRVESLHIWPPGDKALIQIGRFGIPYEIGEEKAPEVKRNKARSR